MQGRRGARDEAIEGALRIDERRGVGLAKVHGAAEVGEARLATAPVEQDLAADLAGRMQRQIDGEAGVAQYFGPVVFADRVGLALLLVELEEEGAAVARGHEAVERIEAVAVAVDLDGGHRQVEGGGDQAADHGLRFLPALGARQATRFSGGIARGIFGGIVGRVAVGHCGAGSEGAPLLYRA